MSGAKERFDRAKAGIAPAKGVMDGIRKDMQAEKLGLKPKGGTAWSHGFLNQKYWHPLSYRNQERLFKAEQEEEAKKKRNELAKKEFAEQAEFFKNTELLSQSDRDALRNRQQLAFMYQQPPGFKEMQEREKEEAEERKRREMEDLKAREEEAAREAAGLPPLVPEKPKRHHFKKDMYGKNVMTEEEMPELRGAPKMDGVGLARVQPFGKQVKAVQCLRCGGFGHQSGDKECPMRDQNPADEFRVKLEDPLTLMRARDELMNSRKFALRTPMTCGRSPTRGGCDPDAANQQMLVDDAQVELEAGRPSGILDSLPRSERKRLIKEYRAQEKASKKAKIKAAEDYLRSQGVLSSKGKDKKGSKKQR